MNLASLDGTNGSTFTGGDDDDEAGISVAGAGGVSGDGFDDIVVGASNARPGNFFTTNAGKTYVVFGGPAPCVPPSPPPPAPPLPSVIRSL